MPKAAHLPLPDDVCCKLNVLNCGVPHCTERVLTRAKQSPAVSRVCSYMQVTHPNWNANFGSCAEAPSFLYAMPLADGQVFLEETCLVARPTLPFSVLKRRLYRRCAAMGIKIKEVRHYGLPRAAMFGSLLHAFEDCRRHMQMVGEELADRSGPGWLLVDMADVYVCEACRTCAPPTTRPSDLMYIPVSRSLCRSPTRRRPSSPSVAPCPARSSPSPPSAPPRTSCTPPRATASRACSRRAAPWRRRWSASWGATCRWPRAPRRCGRPSGRWRSAGRCAARQIRVRLDVEPLMLHTGGLVGRVCVTFDSGAGVAQRVCLRQCVPLHRARTEEAVSVLGVV